MGEGQQSFGKSMEVATLQRDLSSLGTARKTQQQDQMWLSRQTWKVVVYMPISSVFGSTHLPEQDKMREGQRCWRL